MLDFINRTADLGITTPLTRKERKYQGQTITDMRQDLLERAKVTIKELKAHEGGPLRAPMARSIRNGLSVKIGYGKRNVGFFEGPKDARTLVIPNKNFDRKLAAIDYLEQAIAAVKAGEFDQMLQSKLSEMTSRFSDDADTDGSTAEDVPALSKDNVLALPKTSAQSHASGSE